MLKLNDGRNELWQWDTSRKLTVGADCSQVHFSNKVFGRSIDVDVVDGVAIIPDILLQTDKDLNAWAFAGTPENGYTKISKTFKVNRRNKPADYVFTPLDQTSLEEIKEKIEYLESIQDPDAIKNAVENYLEQNPVEVQVQSVNGKTGTVELNAEDVGAISQDDLQKATNEALAQAKASGEFDGADGAPGKDGADGKSAYQYAVEAGYTGTEAEFSARMAAEIPSVDSMLTQSGQAADAAAVGARLSSISEEKVSLPKAEDGNVIHGTVGWYAVSDGAGGITWVESAPSTGGGGGATTHGIVWDLVNVTSSNSVASVKDGASLSAVLTPADGYTLGDVIVTMGGEVVTGVWNADTATVTIATVTGDVVISCAGVVVYEETPVTINWVNGEDASGIFTENYAALAYISHVDLIDATKHDLKLHMPFDSTYCTEGSTQKALKVYVYSDNTQESCLGRYKIDTGEISATATAWDYLTWDTDLIIPSGYYVRIFMNKSGTSSNANLLSYFQNHTVAYLVTPTATVEASAAQAVDDDYAMDYGISTLALVTDESANTKTGIDSAYAAVIEEAKNAWMLAANGDMDKIPLIIHTDQHGHMNGNNKLFSFVSEIVNWYDISKVINLGDTTSNWIDGDTEHPLTECIDLESYLEAMVDVPFSKRIEIFGNHDTWDDSSGTGSYTGLTPQNYLHKYFRNIYARRADNYGNFVVKDDNYNIKYVVVSGFAYDSELGGYAHYVMHPDSIRWAIAEMEKADGYDIILLSHVPLDVFTYKDIDALWSGRKAKTSGTVTDEYGNSYDFDFTQCDGELLCALHGHNHEDGNAFMGDLLYAWFDGMLNANACHFLLVDRANRQLNVWKVDSTPQYQNYQIPLDKPAE